MNIQCDFGGFDPSFLGVTLRFSSVHAWETSRRFTRSPSPLPVGHLPLEQKIEILSIESVFSHELRHFYDFLLSANSAHIFSLRIQALVNILQIIDYILQSDANCLLVPISKWCRLNNKERIEVLNRLPPHPNGKNWRPVDLPYIKGELKTLKNQKMIPGPKALKEIIHASIYCFERIKEYTYNPNTVQGQVSFQPWQIYELSGLLVQIQDISYMYGAQESNEFIGYLRSAINNPYFTVLSLVGMMVKDEMIRDINVVSAIVAWCLLGSYELDKWDACPTVRFIRLWHLLSEGTSLSIEKNTRQIFEKLSRISGLSTVQQGFLDTHNTFLRVHNLLEKSITNLSSAISEDYAELLIRITDNLSKASDHMIEHFNDEPSTYVHPYSFVQEASWLVNPIVRIVFDGDLKYSTPLEELERLGYIIQWAVESEDKEVLAESIIEPCNLTKHIFLDPHDVGNLSALIGLGDFLFMETAASRTRLDAKKSGQIFSEKTHIKPLNLDLFL